MKRYWMWGTFSLLVGGLLLSSAALAVRSARAEGKQETVTYRELTTAGVAAYTQDSTKPIKIDYTLATAELFPGTPERAKEFTAVSEGNLVYNKEGTEDWSNSVIFGGDFIRSKGIGRNAVIKFTAKENTEVTVSNGTISGVWAKDSYFDTYAEKSGTLVWMDSKKIGAIGTANGENVDVAADALKVSVHLAQGDSMYYVYRSDWGQINGLSLNFMFDTDKYDKEWQPTAFTGEEEKEISYSDLVSTVAGLGGKTWQTGLFDLDLYAGGIDSTTHFDAYAGEGIGASDDALLYGDWKDGVFNATSGRLVRWEARGNVVFAFTAKDNVKAIIDLQGMNTWSGGMSCSIYVKSGEMRLKIKEQALTNDTSAQVAFSGEAHLKKGEKAYLVLSGSELINIGGASRFTIAKSDYDETKRLPFEALESLQAYAEKVARDCTLTGQARINAIVTETIEKSTEANADVEKLIAAAKAEIDKAERGADYADVFKKFIDGGLQSVPNAYAEISLNASKDPKNGFLGLSLMNGEPRYKEPGANDFQAGFAPSQIVARESCHAAVTVKALKDMKLTVRTPKLGENYQWVANEGQTEVNYYLNDGTSVYFLKQERITKDAEYGYTAHLKAGESLYYTIQSKGWSTVDLLPSFLFGDDYNEQTATLVKEKLKAFSNLEEEYAKYAESDYKAESYALITAAYNTAKAGIETETEIKNISSHIDAFIDSANSVMKKVTEDKILSASITLGQDITVHYRAVLTDAHLAAQMRFTFCGQSFTTDGKETGENEYVYSFAGIAPHMMGENLKAELVLNGKALAVKDEYSVETYCKNMLVKEGVSESLKTLLADLLAYGAAAQNYKNYKTDSLVNAENAGTPSQFTEIVETGERFTSGSLEGCRLVSVNVRFDSVNQLKFTFSAASTDGLILKVTKNGKTTEYRAEDFIALGENRYAVYTEAIYAIEFDEDFTATLVQNETEGDVVVYSVKAYAAHWQQSENEVMRNLAKALYNYGKSAQAYQAEQNS